MHITDLLHHQNICHIFKGKFLYSNRRFLKSVSTGMTVSVKNARDQPSGIVGKIYLACIEVIHVSRDCHNIDNFHIQHSPPPTRTHATPQISHRVSEKTFHFLMYLLTLSMFHHTLTWISHFADGCYQRYTMSKITFRD